MGEARIVVAHLGAGQYEAWLDGRLLCVGREPFFEAARVLLAEGLDPETHLTMWRADDPYPSLMAKLRVAAGLTVEENSKVGPRFRRYEPMLTDAVSRARVAPRTAVCDPAGVGEPETETAVWGQG